MLSVWSGNPTLFRIGRRADLPANMRTFPGAIDEVMVFDVALSGEVIRQHWLGE